MKLIVLYHPHSESARLVEEYVHQLEHDHPQPIQLMSLETREGAATASLYDVVQYPALVVVDDIGHPQNVWQGGELPLINEVLGYLSA